MSPQMTPKAQLPGIEVKDRAMNDPGFLDIDETTKEAGRHYRWVRCRSDEHMITITKTKLKGYRIETQRDGGPKTHAELEKRPDNVIAVGDLILMSCPIELYTKRERDRISRQESLFQSISAQTEEMARDKGISIIKDVDHKI